MHILGKIENKQIHSDPRVHQEYERLINLPPFLMEPKVVLQNTSENSELLSICLLNIGSLRKHSLDLKFDHSLFSSDVLALTETHLQPYDFDSNIMENLNPFELHRQDNSDK